MTYKLITTSYPSGYNLASKYAGVLILSTGSIGGTGLKLATAANVGNDGAIVADFAASNANNGISVNAGATIRNGSATQSASIEGYSGIFATSAPVTVHNYSLIQGFGPGGDGVFAVAGGLVTNGAANDVTAKIVGAHSGVVTNALATVVNYGTIWTFSASYPTDGVDGVALAAGGSLVNGSAADTQALIFGRIAGVVATKSAGVVNYGTIHGAEGVDLAGGGTVTNGSTATASAVIYGSAASGCGVAAGATPVTIINFGTIKSANLDGLYMRGGGVITNGDKDHTGALISGGYFGVFGGLAEVANFGTIQGLADDGVKLNGGTVINGSAGDLAAYIHAGLAGVYLTAAGTVTNFGAIRTTDPNGSGVILTAGGLVTNGSATDRSALINGRGGVQVYGAAGTVRNYATIAATGSNTTAVELAAGGTVANGSASDTAAYVGGDTGVRFVGNGTVNNFGVINGVRYDAVFAGGVATVVNGSNTDKTAKIVGVRAVAMGGSGTVRNFGTILSSARVAVAMFAGGVVTNGSSLDLSALIQGPYALDLVGCAVTNFATILGGAAHAGVYLSGGSLTNGSATVGSALIGGDLSGVNADQAATIANFATINSRSGAGVVLGSGCVLVNGAAGLAGAVEGETGVSVSGNNATIDNFGVIYGSRGVAVDFTGGGDILKVEAGGAFYGAVIGGGGTLELVGGTGTISGFAHGDALVSGAIVPAGFTDFNAFEIGAAAKFTLVGPGNLTAGRGLTVDGTLTVAGTLASAGNLTVTQVLAGAGTLALTAGTATFQTGTVLTIAKVTQSGGAAAFTAVAISVSHPWVQTAGTVSVAAGDKVSFTAAGNSFAGTLTGTGAIAFTGGSDTLANASLSATSMTVSGAAVTLAGAITLATTLSITATNFTIAASGATLSGVGALSLTNLATNAIRGGPLTNSGKIIGAGLISLTSLTNKGTIEADFSNRLTVSTGIQTIANAGVIENVSTGGLTIASAVANTGSLIVTKGTLTCAGSLAGTGSVKIEGGTADLAGAFSGAVTFTSAGGTLVLARSRTDTVKVSGFAKTPITRLDLTDIALVGASVSYSGTSASGTLTVRNGAAVAAITLVGNYTTSTFTLADDGSGHVLVTDPAPTPARPPVTTLPLVAAIAGFGTGGAGSLATAPPNHVTRLTMIAAPA